MATQPIPEAELRAYLDTVPRTHHVSGYCPGCGDIRRVDPIDHLMGCQPTCVQCGSELTSLQLELRNTEGVKR